MESFLRIAGEKALHLAKKNGVEAEAFLLYDRELSIDISGGKVETLKEAEETGIGLRVINKSRIGFAYSSDLSDRALEDMVKDAVITSKYTTADEYNVLPGGNYSYIPMGIYDDEINNISLEEKIELGREVERIARASDKRISLVERAGYEDGEYSSLLMNTNGLYAYGRANFTGTYIFLVAEEDGDEQNGFSVMVKKKFSDLDAVQVAEEASRRALRSLKARNIPSAKMPCIMEPYVVSRFLNILASPLEADNVQKGKSMFAGKEGQVLASKVVNIIDDAAFIGGIASFPFDGEGVPAQKNSLIEAGQLKGFLYDSYTAAKAGIGSTGNGQRGSFRSLPSVGTTNFILQAGESSPEKLISELERGIYITEVMGMHTANPISGDFSVGAAGIMIENGRLTYPIRGITIAGNLLHLLKNIEAVGNDTRFYGGTGAATVRLQSMSIGGE